MYRPNSKSIGFVAGVIVFIVICFLPATQGLSIQGKFAAACASLMAIWWISETIPLAATALLPLVLFPLFKVLPAKQTGKQVKLD